MKRFLKTAIATIFTLLLSVFAFGCRSEEAKLPQKDGNGYYILPEATFHYNITTESGTIVDYTPPEGYFQEDLDEEELSSLTPDERFSCTGKGSWNGEGKLLDVFIVFSVENQNIYVHYAVSPNTRMDLSNSEISKCNAAEFVVNTVYNYEKTEIVRYEATGRLGDQIVSISTDCWTNDPEQVRTAFETAVRWMSVCNAMDIDATTVQYAEIPEYYTLELNLEEAYADPTFGHLVPHEFPYGLGRKSIERRKNYYTDLLSLNMRNSRDKSLYLSWKIFHFTDNDKKELLPSEQVTPENVMEKHCPTVRVEDITIEVLAALMSDSDPYYVKVGDYKIYINSGSITPEEMYGLLQQISGTE